MRSSSGEALVGTEAAEGELRMERGQNSLEMELAWLQGGLQEQGSPP